MWEFIVNSLITREITLAIFEKTNMRHNPCNPGGA
jgi:hypothetical protein